MVEKMKQCQLILRMGIAQFTSVIYELSGRFAGNYRKFYNVVERIMCSLHPTLLTFQIQRFFIQLLSTFQIGHRFALHFLFVNSCTF